MKDKETIPFSDKDKDDGRDHFYKFFITSSDIMVIADPNGAFMKTNPSCTEILGYTEAELIAKPFVEFIHPEDKQPTLDEMAKQLQRGFSLNFENRYICKDGSFRWLSWRATYSKDEGITYATARDITELKSAEEALERIFTLSFDMICVADFKGYFKKLNPSWEKTLGYAKEELLNTPFVDFIHPDDKNKTTAVIKEQLALGVPLFNFENRYRCKDGSYKWLSWTANPEVEKGLIYAIARDSTERKQAEAALRESEQEFRLLAEAMPQIVWATRPDGWNIYFNHQWVEYTGMTLEESYGHGWNIPFHPEDKQRAWDAWQNATQNGASYVLECRLRRADGVYKWWLIRGVPVMDPKGAITKWFGTCTDIDKMKQAEEEIQNLNKELEQRVVERTAELEDINRVLQDEISDHRKSMEALEEAVQRLQLATASGQLGIWDWNVQTNLMIWNDRMFELYGITRDVFTDTVEAWINGLHPDDSAGAISECEEALRGGKEFNTEFRVGHPDGTVKVLKANAIVIKDSDGKTVRMLGLNRDVTELREAEGKLIKAHADLERKVQERTAELSAANAALTAEIGERKQAEEIIKQSLREKDSLLREIHHRVKNNLAVVSSLLSLQARKIDDDTVRQLFEESQQRVKSMALVHEKLYQTKDLSAVNFEDYMRSMISEIAGLYRINTHIITTEISIKDVELDLELAIPCGLIINEILTNAFKYAFPDNRKGIINVHFIKAGDTYTLSIKDNGVGLPEGFDYKASNTLGLQIVNALTGQLRGIWQIESDMGTKAVVTFTDSRGLSQNKGDYLGKKQENTCCRG